MSYNRLLKDHQRPTLRVVVCLALVLTGLLAPAASRADGGESGKSGEKDSAENKDEDNKKKKIELSWESELKFGAAASDLTLPGTVIIDAVANSRSVTGGLFDFGGSWSRGKFRIEGQKKANVFVSLPASIVLQNAGGTYSITVTNLRMNLPNPVKLSSDGKKTVYIGGTLQVTANQKASHYTDIGTLIVDVEYQ